MNGVRGSFHLARGSSVENKNRENRASGASFKIIRRSALVGRRLGRLRARTAENRNSIYRSREKKRTRGGMRMDGKSEYVFIRHPVCRPESIPRRALVPRGPVPRQSLIGGVFMKVATANTAN